MLCIRFLIRMRRRTGEAAMRALCHTGKMSSPASATLEAELRFKWTGEHFVKKIPDFILKSVLVLDLVGRLQRGYSSARRWDWLPIALSNASRMCRNSQRQCMPPSDFHLLVLGFRKPG